MMKSENFSNEEKYYRRTRQKQKTQKETIRIYSLFFWKLRFYRINTYSFLFHLLQNTLLRPVYEN